LIFKSGHEYAHSQVKHLADAVPEGTLFILNDSRVIASRIHGSLKTGARVEILLIEPLMIDGREFWRCLGRPMKKLHKGTAIQFEGDLTVEVAEDPTPHESGPQPFLIKLSLQGSDLLRWLEKHGEMPLPPYISRKDQSERVRLMDKDRYQTVYASGEGSVAAPTAGLHLTDQVLSSLKSKNCQIKTVTLHVGAGTFLPVKAQDPARHVMHNERFLVPRATLDAIENAKRDGRPVVVVGTTALRSLEGLKREAGKAQADITALADQWLRTDIFIRPAHAADRHKSWCADALMTNFHQPESTLFMLISALIGYNDAKNLYAHAISSGFRFFSYGDSSLLWLNDQ
jgi:S-adenosylmethionine:tRNA ribosyltransferase-isomerase